MKRYIFALTVFCGLILSSCKFERLSNGGLDGYWHMTQVDTLYTGKNADVSEERIFWAVEGKLLQLRYMGKTDKSGYSDTNGYYLRFSKSDTELSLSDPYINGWHEDAGETGGDTPLKDTLQLQIYGIYGLPERYSIEELSGSNMTLKSDTLRLHFARQ